VRKHGIYLTLLATQALSAAAGVVFYVVGRPKLLEAFRGVDLSVAAEAALSRWYLPAIVLAAAALDLVSLAPGLRPKQRLRLVATGVVLVAFGVAAAVLAAYGPVFAVG
jgi:hypothetical protein